MGDDKLNERVAVVETEINIIKGDITDIKEDIDQLKSGQNETNLNIKELTVLLRESLANNSQVIQQNSVIIADMNNRLEESNKMNNERYIEMIKINSKQDIENTKEKAEIRKDSNNKTDSFKEFLIDIGKTVFKYAITGGLLYYIFIGKDINL